MLLYFFYYTNNHNNIHTFRPIMRSYKFRGGGSTLCTLRLRSRDIEISGRACVQKSGAQSSFDSFPRLWTAPTAQSVTWSDRPCRAVIDDVVVLGRAR